MLLMRKWQRSLEKSAELRKDLFCLETLESCGYSWMSGEEVYGDLCVCCNRAQRCSQLSQIAHHFQIELFCLCLTFIGGERKLSLMSTGKENDRD